MWTSLDDKIQDFIPVPEHRKVMEETFFTRPTYSGSSTFSSTHADMSGGCKLPLLDDSREDLAAALDGDDNLPVIKGLFSHATDAQEQTCSLEYWLSIFGTTGATPVGQAIKFPIEVTNGLFMGNETFVPSLAALNAHGIKHVINAAPDTLFLPYGYQDAGISYFQLDGLYDTPTSHILSYLAPVCDFISAAQEAGERVLVSSAKGINRCVCIVLAYLIQIGFAASIREAVAAVREVHPAARVSRRFIYDLDQFCNRVASEAGIPALQNVVGRNSVQGRRPSVTMLQLHQSKNKTRRTSTSAQSVEQQQGILPTSSKQDDTNSTAC